jgi:hypothetical protein
MNAACAVPSGANARSFTIFVPEMCYALLTFVLAPAWAAPHLAVIASGIVHKANHAAEV